MGGWSLLCVAGGGVAVPGSAGGGGLAAGGGVVEPEGLRGDGGGDLEDELAECGNPGGAHREAQVAQLGEHGAVGQRLAGGPAGEQPGTAGRGAGGEFVEQAGEGLGDGAGWVAEAQEQVTAVAVGEGAGGQVEDAGEWLGVEQHEAGGGAGARWDVGVGEVVAQQGQAAVLGDGAAGGEPQWGQLAAGQVAVVHGPVQEAAGGLPLADGVGGVPGVEVGLGELGQAAALIGGPGKECRGVDELQFGVFAGGGAQRPGGGFGTHFGQLVPQPELAQQPLVGVGGQPGEAQLQPAFEVGQLPVGGGQHAAAGQKVTQVDGGPPVGVGGEGLMGERQLAGGQVRQQLADVGRGEPVHGRGVAGAGGQGGGQGLQGGADGAGAVVEQPG